MSDAVTSDNPFVRLRRIERQAIVRRAERVPAVLAAYGE